MAQRIDAKVEVEAPVKEVYDYWKTLENLPKFMSNIEDIRPTGPDTTHWVVRGPLGYKAEFDAKTTQNEPNEALGWTSENGDVKTSGQVRFKEMTPNRTQVEVQMNYWDPPGGKLGEAASRITSGPKAIVRQDLQNFKDLMEGKATAEEIQQRPSAADAHSGAVTFLTPSTGLLVVGGIVLLWLLFRDNGSRGKRSRIIFEF